jgi:hypothetical protein
MSEYNVQQPDWVVLEPKRGQAIAQVLYLNNQTNAPFSLHVCLACRFGSQSLRVIGMITMLT